MLIKIYLAQILLPPPLLISNNADTRSSATSASTANSREDLLAGVQTASSTQSGSDSNPIAFSSVAIGNTKASKSNSQGYFVEQNLEAQQKEAQSQARRHHIFKTVTVVGVGVTALTIIVVVAISLYRNYLKNLPAYSTEEVAELSESPATASSFKIKQEAQDIFNDGGNADDVKKFYDNEYKTLKNTDLNKTDDSLQTSAKINLVILEMQTYTTNLLPGLVISAAERVTESELESVSALQRASYYGMLYNTYAEIGDNEKASIMFERFSVANAETQPENIKITY